MSEKPEDTDSELRTVTFKIFWHTSLIDIKYKDKDDLYESLKKKMEDLGVPLENIYSFDGERTPYPLDSPDAVMEASLSGRLMTACRIGDKGSKRGELVHHHRPHGRSRSHSRDGNCPYGRRSSSSSSSSERGDRSPSRCPCKFGERHHPREHGQRHHPHHHGPPPPHPGPPCCPFGTRCCPAMSSGYRGSCPFFGHGFGHGHDYGQGHGRGFHDLYGRGYGYGYCPRGFHGY